MSLDNDIRMLSKVELFSSFDTSQLRLLAFGCEKLNFPEGAQVFYDGQPSDGGYLILEGNVELWIEQHGFRKTLAEFGPGDLVGEISMLTKNNRIGSALATTDCHLLRISRATVTRILGEYPELAADLHDRIADQITEFANELAPVGERMDNTD